MEAPQRPNTENITSVDDTFREEVTVSREEICDDIPERQPSPEGQMGVLTVGEEVSHREEESEYLLDNVSEGQLVRKSKPGTGNVVLSEGEEEEEEQGEDLLETDDEIPIDLKTHRQLKNADIYDIKNALSDIKLEIAGLQKKHDLLEKALLKSVKKQSKKVLKEQAQTNKKLEDLEKKMTEQGQFNADQFKALMSVVKELAERPTVTGTAAQHTGSQVAPSSSQQRVSIDRKDILEFQEILKVILNACKEIFYTVRPMNDVVDELLHLAVSHNTLYSIMKIIADDAKKGERARRYHATYRRPEERQRSPTPVSPVRIPRLEIATAEFAKAQDELMEKKRKNPWYGYGDPHWTDSKTPEQWKREGGIRNGQWIDPEKYDHTNLPPWSENLKPKEKVALMKELNHKIYERKKKENELLNDLTLIDKTASLLMESLEKVGGDQEQLVKILEKLVTKSTISLADGRSCKECIDWWYGEALDGINIFEAFKKYIKGDLTPQFRRCKRRDFKDTRHQVNNQIWGNQ